MKSKPTRIRNPSEIMESIKRFREDYPASQKVAFIMMQFGKTKAHNAIVASLRNELGSHGIKAVRADHKEYHEDLFWNIMTYIYGCEFGIAIFERLEMDEFNPNIALEVGYMMALKKPILLLKDRTLKNLNTDLIGKLYKTFDPQAISGTLAPKARQWLKDKGFIKSDKEQQVEMLALSEFVVDEYWQSFSRLSDMKSLENLFVALKESASFDNFMSRCFPRSERRKSFIEALRQTADGELFLKKANHLRRNLGLSVYLICDHVPAQ